MNKPLRREDLTIRPFFRVAGAVLLAFLSYVFFVQGLPLFGATSIAPEQCHANKQRLLCELGNWLLSITPIDLQGPIAAIAHLLMATLLAAVISLLVKPLFKRR